MSYTSRHVFLAALPALLLSMADAHPQTPTVSDTVTLSLQAGELQSTVVAPGVNKACSGGRVLVSDDLKRPPEPGIVTSRDLDSGVLTTSSFNLPPHADDYRYGSNDHDLVSLGNGDVLYAIGAFSKAPLFPKPAWYDLSYRGDFGPGARSNLMVWKSSDCGTTFNFVSEFDPARVTDGSCAFPQLIKDKTGKVIAPTDPPGSPGHPRYDMGGSDGQLVHVDKQSNLIYLTFECVGYKQDLSKTGFTLSDQPLSQMIVAISNDGGESWQTAGVVPFAQWRSGVARLNNRMLELGLQTGFTYSHPVLGLYQFDAANVAAAPGLFPAWNEENLSELRNLNTINASIWASTVVTQVPDNLLLMAIPTMTLSQRPGYRVFFYDPLHLTYNELNSITSISPSADGIIFHLVAVQADVAGPVLLYWSDFDGSAGTATVRGRLIYGANGYSSDFQISKNAGNAYNWNLKKDAFYWYGDYQTASGYVKYHFTGNFASATLESHFFPVWPQPNGTVGLAEVKTSSPAFKQFKPEFGKEIVQSVDARKAVRALLQPLDKLKPNLREVEDLDKYDFHGPDRHR